MKLDRIDWKILAFKVGFFFEQCPTILDGFDHHLWKKFKLWILNLNFFMMKN